MRSDIGDHVGVAVDDEVKPPMSIDPSLPDIVRLVILLSVQRRMVQVQNEKAGLLIEGLAERGGKTLQDVEGPQGVVEFHRTGLDLFAVRRDF